MINVVTKGKDGEREVKNMFKAALKGLIPDVEAICRNQRQAEIGGSDILGVPYLSIEVKRVRQINWAGGLDAWWEQAVEQAEKDGKEPCLVFRQNHGAWLVMVYAMPFITRQETVSQPMIMTWRDFVWYMQEHMVEWLECVDTAEKVAFRLREE